MFDFQRLEVYRKAKEFNQKIRATIVRSANLDHATKNQLLRAAMSVTLNIAEGAGRFTKPDKRNFYVIARGSVFECIAVMDILIDDRVLSKSQYEKFYDMGEELSKMLYGMIRKLEIK